MERASKHDDDPLLPSPYPPHQQLKALHSDVTSQHRTSLESVHLIQHVIREANLLLLWLRYGRVGR